MSQRQPPTPEERDEDRAAAAGVSTAERIAASQKEQLANNPRFLAELSKSGLGEDAKEDIGPLLADSFITANRDVVGYRRWIKWINENEGERDVVRNTPGRHLKERPLMLAVANDLHLRPDRDVDDVTPPMSSDERAEHRRRMRAVTAFQSLGAGGKGVETVGTVQTSTEINRSTEESKSTRERLESLYR